MMTEANPQPTAESLEALVDEIVPDPAAEALRSAAHEFVHDHGWSLDGETGGVPEPFEETEFFQVLARHLAPILDVDAYKAARIAALRAELRALED